MQPGTKVYVRWYGRTLEGEVAGSDGFMGMTPVRIPLDGHHPVALFMPQHVYDSPKKLTEISVDQSKVDTDVLECFKESHWDEAHNHLRTDSLEEFYQLWLQAHGGRSSQAEASVTCQSHTPKPVPAQSVPQNGTPFNTKQLHKKKPAKAMELSLFD